MPTRQGRLEPSKSDRGWGAPIPTRRPGVFALRRRPGLWQRRRSHRCGERLSAVVGGLRRSIAQYAARIYISHRHHVRWPSTVPGHWNGHNPDAAHSGAPRPGREPVSQISLDGLPGQKSHVSVSSKLDRQSRGGHRKLRGPHEQRQPRGRGRFLHHCEENRRSGEADNSIQATSRDEPAGPPRLADVSGTGFLISTEGKSSPTIMSSKIV